MRILLFIPRLDDGGPDRVFKTLALELPKFGVEAVVLTQYSGGRYWEELQGKVPLYSIENRGSRPAGFPVLGYARAVRELRPDVVLATLRSILTSCAARMLLLVRVPLVLRPANHVTRNAQVLIKSSKIKHSISWLSTIVALHCADSIICQSQDIRSDLLHYFIPDKKLSVIGNPISEVPSVSTERESRVLKGTPSLLAVGRLDHQKGFDLLIQAFGILHSKLPDSHLHIVGEGRGRQELMDLVTKLGLDDVVTFHGHCDDVNSCMRAASMLVSSSRYEGFPNVIQEALAVDLTVVATNCPGGTRELVIDGLTGWLAQEVTPESIASAVVKAWSMRTKFSVDRARLHLEKNFSAEKIAFEYVQALVKHGE